MRTSYTIHLDSVDLGQLLDGLESRALSWERTACFLRTGKMPEGEFFLAEECNKPEEADDIGRRYRAIIATIRTQMKAQS